MTAILDAATVGAICRHNNRFCAWPTCVCSTPPETTKRVLRAMFDSVEHDPAALEAMACALPRIMHVRGDTGQRYWEHSTSNALAALRALKAHVLGEDNGR